MRETCARVLAAALMTAAIAMVVGMSALFGATSAPDTPLAAPPSSLERSVRLVARPEPRHARPVIEIPVVQTVSAPVHSVVTIRSLVVIHTKPALQPQRHLAAVQPEFVRVLAPSGVRAVRGWAGCDRPAC
jgi:hypothetical protein